MRYAKIPMLYFVALLLSACSNQQNLFDHRKIDERSSPVARRDLGRVWYDLKDFVIDGQGWIDTESRYDRLPARAKTVVRPEVWALSHDSAGLGFRFHTASQSISLRWTLNSSDLAMGHMPASGVSGIDLYTQTGEGWRWLGLAQAQDVDSSLVLTSELPEEEREYRLYFPLYNGISQIQIGVEDGAQLFQTDAIAHKAGKKLVVYGTSIVQGCCASRPGMVHTAIVGRALDAEVVNLGFDGNGTMDPELIPLLAELDTTAYILDCLPNMTTEMIAERVEPFVRGLRELRPTTPIVLVENPNYANDYLYRSGKQRTENKRQALAKAVEHLRETGETNLTVVAGEGIFGNEGTVDGLHPTDLGFTRLADAYLAALRPLQ